MNSITSQYHRLIDSMPTGLDRALLRTLMYHQGRENCISRTDLIRSVYPLKVHERQLRQQIRLLRRQGYLIGRFLATNIARYHCNNGEGSGDDA